MFSRSLLCGKLVALKERIKMSRKMLKTVLVFVLLCGAPLLAGGTWARTLTPAERGAVIRQQMLRRGSPAGEISLALAAHFAREKQQKEVYFYINQARKQGIHGGRIDLVLGSFFRRVGRYDAAFSTLVRVLVNHDEQPHALVELWKTLYRCKLQGAETKTDTDGIRSRLAESGLHFPRRFPSSSTAGIKSKELAASGYNALLSHKNKFAAELFEASLDQNPSNAQAHRGLGISRARLGDYARAAGAYLVYMKLAPHAPDADGVDKILMEYWKNKTATVK